MKCGAAWTHLHSTPPGSGDASDGGESEPSWGDARKNVVEGGGLNEPNVPAAPRARSGLPAGGLAPAASASPSPPPLQPQSPISSDVSTAVSVSTATSAVMKLLGAAGEVTTSPWNCCANRRASDSGGSGSATAAAAACPQKPECEPSVARLSFARLGWTTRLFEGLMGLMGIESNGHDRSVLTAVSVSVSAVVSDASTASAVGGDACSGGDQHTEVRMGD